MAPGARTLALLSALALTGVVAGCVENRKADCAHLRGVFDTPPTRIDQGLARNKLALWDEKRGQISSDTVRKAGDQYALALSAWVQAIRAQDGTGNPAKTESSEANASRGVSLAKVEKMQAGIEAACRPLTELPPKLPVEAKDLPGDGDYRAVAKALAGWKAEDTERAAQVKLPPKPEPRRDGLPRIDRSSRPKAVLAAAEQLNVDGLKAHRKGNYEQAASQFRAAVLEDPGHLNARFNLSCALALQEKTDEAFATLEGLKVESCPKCLGRLARVHKDSDWAALRTDPRFAELTHDLEDLVPTQRISALEMREWIKKPHMPTPKVIDERSKVSATTRCGNCDPKAPNDTTVTLRGASRIKEWAQGFRAGNGVIFGPNLRCRGDCCTFPGVDLGVGHNVIVLEEICFKRDAGHYVDVTKLTVTSH